MSTRTIALQLMAVSLIGTVNLARAEYRNEPHHWFGPLNNMTPAQRVETAEAIRLGRQRVDAMVNMWKMLTKVTPKPLKLRRR